jgi:hypothetical protein
MLARRRLTVAKGGVLGWVHQRTPPRPRWPPLSPAFPTYRAGIDAMVSTPAESERSSHADEVLATADGDPAPERRSAAVVAVALPGFFAWVPLAEEYTGGLPHEIVQLFHSSRPGASGHSRSPSCSRCSRAATSRASTPPSATSS